MKFYAVRKGRQPGVYTTWDDCKTQTMGYPGAVYKSFEAYQDAEDFLNAAKKESAEKDALCPLTVYTDGSFEENLGGWGYVMLDGGIPCFEAYGPCTKRNEIRNIGGELEAAEEAITKAAELGADYLRIHHDYEGVGRWGDGEWKTNRPETESFVRFVKKMRSVMTIEFVKVKGHSDDVYNEVADALADKGRRSNKKVEITEGSMMVLTQTPTTSARASECPEIMDETPSVSGENNDIDPEDYVICPCDFTENGEYEFTASVEDIPQPTGSKSGVISTAQEEKPTEENTTEPASTIDTQPEASADEKLGQKEDDISFTELLEKMRKRRGLSKVAAAQATDCNRYAKLELGEDVRITAAELRAIYVYVVGEESGVSPEKFAMMWLTHSNKN